MAEIQRRCMGCMHEIDDVRVCPYCGYDDDTPYSNSFLRPKTVLKDRYLIGKALRSNGEGITYIAYDLIINTVVEIREYFPDQLSERGEEDGEIVILPGSEAQFKALLSDFHDLYASLQKMRTLTALCNVYDVFEANNSLYAVLEHVQGVSLNRYIQDNAGQLEWSRVAELILPLLKSIGAMHGQQMIHRGISPDTIYVTKKGELKLCGFCISSARNVKSEISPELFAGYTAPEQYSANVLQGTWTDV